MNDQETLAEAKMALFGTIAQISSLAHQLELTLERTRGDLQQCREIRRQLQNTMETLKCTRTSSPDQRPPWQTD